MNIYKHKIGSGKITELSAQFNRTDFGRLINGFAKIPSCVGAIVFFLNFVCDIVNSNMNIWNYTLILMSTIFVSCITQLLYLYLLKDYVSSLKEEK